MTSVLVCDDTYSAREALRRVVSSLHGIGKVTTAASGEELLSRYSSEVPDVVLLDLRMPGLGGIETTRRLIAQAPHACVVALSSGQDFDEVGQSITAGARGFVLKDAAREELATTLALVHQDQPRPEVSSRAVVLTERERQVLNGMARGLSNGQIGAELFLSEDTIKTHARRLFRKMGTHDRAHAVAQGLRWGLLH